MNRRTCKVRVGSDMHAPSLGRSPDAKVGSIRVGSGWRVPVPAPLAGAIPTKGS
ncbi:hypothetical protein MishRS11D_38270 [Methylomagnum ishizawai]|nr:hypothetical protein MishRS11D_38270 [Methylomagnum ishizawai]